MPPNLISIPLADLMIATALAHRSRESQHAASGHDYIGSTPRRCPRHSHSGVQAVVGIAALGAIGEASGGLRQNDVAAAGGLVSPDRPSRSTLSRK